MTGHRILVVEDTPDLALAVSLELEEEGFIVSLAHTGAEARKEIARELPDLAILDMELPDTTGIALCEEIRRSHTIPVIIFSGVSAQTSVKEVIQRGATDYVLKGSGLSELISRVKHRLGSQAKLSGPPGAEPAQLDDIAEATAPDGRQRVLIVEPDEATQASLTELLNYLGYQVIHAASGVDAAALVKKSKPDVLMVALDSPKAGGLKLIQDLRTRGAAKGVGLIGISRRLSPEAVRRAKYHGIASLITRPWNPARIHMEMQQAVQAAIKAARKAA
jgi:DNA-binding response OmpR family regulator